MGRNGQSANGNGQSGGGSAAKAGLPSLVRDLTDAQWLELQNRFQLSPQQGVIVRLLLTQPWYECNHIDIAKLLNTGKSGIDTQVEVIFKRVGVHSRMHLSQAVDYEVVMRGWIGPR